MKTMIKSKNFVRYVTRTLAVAVVAGALPTVVAPVTSIEGFSAYAEQEKRKVPKRPKRNTPLIGNKLFKKFDAAQVAAEAENYAEALEVLGEVKDRGDKLNAYEKAQMWNFYAFIYFSQEKYKEAINAYEKVISFDTVPWGMVDQTHYSLSQLHFSIEGFKKALFHFEEWFKYQATPGASSYVFRGQIHFQLGNKDKALADIIKGIEIQDSKKVQPKENWLQLASVLYFEKKDMKNTLKYSRRLVSLYPKKQYMIFLSGVYGTMGKDKDQLAILSASYQQGYLEKEKEVLNLAYLYLNNDVPVKAANIVEKGINDGLIEKTAKNWETLGNAWYRAREVKKAIPALEKAAAQAKDGEIFYRLSTAYLDLEQFSKSVKAGESALQKGGLRDPGLTSVVLGTAYFYNRQLDKAEALFKDLEAKGKAEDAKTAKNKDGKVIKDKKVIRAGKYARDWLRLVKNEKDQKEKMAEMGVDIDSISYKPRQR